MKFRCVEARGHLPPYPAYWWTEEDYRRQRFNTLEESSRGALVKYAKYRFSSPAVWAAELDWRASDFDDGTEREYVWYGIEAEVENEFGVVIP